MFSIAVFGIDFQDYRVAGLMLSNSMQVILDCKEHNVALYEK